MAILSMKKIALIAHSDNLNSVLTKLQDIGAVEVSHTSSDELDAMDLPSSFVEKEKRLGEVREALEVIRKYDETKSGLLTPKPAITKQLLKNMQESFLAADEVVALTKQFASDMNSLKTRRHRIRNRVTQLEPYNNLDVMLETISDNDYTTCLLGTIPTENIEVYRDICEKFIESAYFEEIDKRKDYISVYVVMTKQIDEELTGELKYIGFSEAHTKDLYGTPADLIFDLNNEYESLGTEAEEYEEKAKKFVDDKLTLQAVEDFLLNEIARERTYESLGQTGSTFMLNGWIIEGSDEQIEKAVLEAAPEAYVTFTDPEETDIPPTAIKNPGVISPFEAVTDMYAVPSQKGFDPNLLMSIFYFLIFGMMMADVAYGLILTIGALLVLKLKKRAPK